MIIIRINGHQRSIDEKYEAWIAEEIGNRRANGVSAEIEVLIDGAADLWFVADDVPRASRAGNILEYSDLEEEIIRLWRDFELNQRPVNPGNLISFLKRAKVLLKL